jgi:hypothetical protein
MSLDGRCAQAGFEIPRFRKSLSEARGWTLVDHAGVHGVDANATRPNSVTNDLVTTFTAALVAL